MVMGHTDVVSTEIESLFTRVFTRVNTGLELHQGRGVCAGGGGGGDPVEGQREGNEQGEEVHSG